MSFPLQFHQLEKELAEKYPKIAEKYVLVGPKKYCLRKEFQSIAGHLYNFKTRPSDVWIYGYPRSGTTMAQEITWLIGSDLDYEKAAQQVLDVRYTFYEKETSINSEFFDNIINNPTKYKDYVIPIVKYLRDPNWITLEKRQDKRFIKTHLAFSTGPSNILTSSCKIFYLARNPKDVIVSNYQAFVKSFRLDDDDDIEEDFDHFWESFKSGLVMWTPFFEHLKEGWEASKTNPNVMFLFYEDYKKDMRKTLVKIATHLDKKLTDQELDKLEEHMKIENFRKNKSVNNDYLRDIGILKDEPDRFIRNGKVGGWKDYLTESISLEMDRWIEENLKTSGLTDFQFPIV